MPSKYIHPIRPVITPIGPSIAYVQLTNGQFALIDSADTEIVGKHNWYALWSRFTQSFYARRAISVGRSKQRILYMHREIMGNPEGMQVDHIHGNTLDNRRSELRLATSAQNNSNAKIRSNNTSGFKGVCWSKDKLRWVSTIRLQKSAIYLGSFSTAEAAYAAYCEASSKYHGEFRRAS